jgi:hypothetical protein
LSILRVGIALVFLDSFIRWSQTYSLPRKSEEVESFLNSEAASFFLSTFVSCLTGEVVRTPVSQAKPVSEIILFHAGILFACTVAFSVFTEVHKDGKGSGIQQELRCVTLEPAFTGSN